MPSSLLTHPLVRNLDANAAGAVTVHQRIIQSKPLMRDIYDRWYQQLADVDRKIVNRSGTAIEIGCGASYLEKFIPDLIKTDIVLHENCNRTLNAQDMDLSPGSVRGIYMTGVLHHIPDAESFFREASRVLQKDGRIVMLEPSDAPLHKLLTNLCNPNEHYDDTAQSWKNSCTGRMTGANNAIPSLIFRRDRELFLQKFPEFEIVQNFNHTFIAYYVTGGMSYISFLPAFCAPLVRMVEWLAHPFFKYLGTMMTVELRKTK